MESIKEHLRNFKVGYNNTYFFKLKNGKHYFGEIKALTDDVLQFEPLQFYDPNSENKQEITQIPLNEIDLNNAFDWDWNNSCWMNALWDASRECWIYEETKFWLINLPYNFPENDNRLKGVGYWAGRDNPYLPHPKFLVDPEWHQGERNQIIEYLQSGHSCSQWRGFSYCRFKCGIDDWHMGYRDLTDGEWIWPEGLAHYVEKHQIRLPDSFVASMQKNSWLVPKKINFSFWREIGVTCSDWIKWAREYAEARSSIA